jgi:4-hydroxybenzoate polyprenyltransferase
MSWIAHWGQFIQERFSPGVHLLLIMPLFAANALVAMRTLGTPWHPLQAVVGIVVTCLIFFRLRVFDEIKDFATDQTIHPDRPLARGLISVPEARQMALLLLLAEGLLVLWALPGALSNWLLVAGFSGLMFKEFFIGPWLRPKMELYAVTHTASAMLIGLFISTATSQLSLTTLPPVVWWFAVANWGAFNVYEFARKTYGTDEEQPHIESYSKRLTPWGAVVLTGINVLLALLGWWMAVGATATLSNPIPFIVGALGLLGLALVVSLQYSLTPQRRQAVIYRNVMQGFIVLFYGAVSVCQQW